MTGWCSVIDCGASIHSRTLCLRHYLSARRRGELPPLQPRPTPAVALARYSEQTETCWLWRGPMQTNGYGRLRLDGVVWAAHRLAWVVANGAPIPAGMHVCHRCDVPICINPEHLFLGSRSDNMRDMVAKGRAYNPMSARTACPQGHPYSGANLYVSPTGRRNCRECRRVQAANYRRRLVVAR